MTTWSSLTYISPKFYIDTLTPELTETDTSVAIGLPVDEAKNVSVQRLSARNLQVKLQPLQLIRVEV